MLKSKPDIRACAPEPGQGRFSDESLEALVRLRLIPRGENRVLIACSVASRLEKGSAIASIIAGLLLLEHRDSLACGAVRGGFPTVGNPPPFSINGRNQHSEGLGFGAWLRENRIAESTAYRWMDAAERVAHHCLGLPTSFPFAPFLDVQGAFVPLSQVLIDPPDPAHSSESVAPRQAFRQSFFDFMAGKSLAEATTAALSGQSDPSRISKAAGGRTKGGTGGENRKDFPFYAACALTVSLSHIGARVNNKGGHWESLSATAKERVLADFGLFVKGLADDLVDYLLDATKVEHSRRLKGHPPEPLALRANLTAIYRQKLGRADRGQTQGGELSQQ